MTEITNEAKAELQTLIDRSLETVTTIIERTWMPRDFNDPVTLTMEQDGLSEPFSLNTNVHALLSVTFHMSDDWGWGWFECLDTVASGTMTIEQEGLTYLPEIFKFLEHNFNTMTPEYQQAEPEQTALFETVLDMLASTVFYEHPFHSADNNIERPEWFTKEAIAPFCTEAALRLIQLLEHGLEEPEHEDTPKEAPRTARLSPLNETVGFAEVQFGFRWADDQDILIRRLITSPGLNNRPGDAIWVHLIDDEAPDNADRCAMHIVTAHSAKPLVIHFNSRTEAYLASVNRNFAMAAAWKYSDLIDSEKALALIEALPIEFTDTVDPLLSEKDVLTEYYADLVIATFGGVLKRTE